MYTLKIVKIEKGFSNPDNAYFIEVEAEVYKDDEIVGIKKLGFPLEYKTEQIEEEISKIAKTLDSDEEIATKEKELAEKLLNVESAQSLIGKQIK